MQLVGLCLMLHAIDAHRLGLGLTQILSRLIIFTHEQMNSRKGKTRLYPLPGLSLKLQLIISQLVFLQGVGVITDVLIQLAEVEMTLSNASLSPCQLIVFQRFTVMIPCRVGLSQRALHLAQIAIIDSNALVITKRHLTQQRLVEYAVGSGIITQLDLDIANAVESNDMLFDGIGIILVAIIITNHKCLKKIAVCCAQVAHETVTGGDIVQGSGHFHCIGQRRGESKCIVVGLYRFFKPRLAAQLSSQVSIGQHLADCIVVMLILPSKPGQRIQIVNVSQQAINQQIMGILDTTAMSTVPARLQQQHAGHDHHNDEHGRQCNKSSSHVAGTAGFHINTSNIS